MGVRTSGKWADIVPNGKGLAHPNTGGLSVAPDDPCHLPDHRRPRSLGGEGRDPVFAMDVSTMPVSLVVRRDTLTHALIGPRHLCPCVEYEQALYRTRQSWRKTHV